MDNRIFNVNGSGDGLLRLALELVFLQEHHRTSCSAWQETKQHGLILMWADSGECSKLPVNLTSEECLPFVSKWLDGEFAKSVELSEMCEDYDHDGSNEKGWQVYCEKWGHVGDNHYSICAIKPAYLWLGK